jgi:predicted MPP superfamily phosphohydrolase
VALTAVGRLASMGLRVRRERLFTRKQARFKVLHITDLHSRGGEFVNIWPEVDKLDFDLTVITGDLILNNCEDLSPRLAEYLRKLARRKPVFFVEGNHESLYYRNIAEVLTACGVRVLYNAGQVVEINGRRINIVGLRDYYYMKDRGFAGLRSAFAGLDTRNFTLVLSHQPQIFERAAAYHADLVLAGHTHGGQLRLPLLPTLYAPGQGFLPRYGDGWYKRGQAALYISRGVGATKFPLRTFNPPEITVIEVKEF